LEDAAVFARRGDLPNSVLRTTAGIVLLNHFLIDDIILIISYFKWIGRKKHAMRVVEDSNNSRIVGFCELGIASVSDRAGKIWLEAPMIGNLVVSQEYRNRGIATSLLLDIEDVAKTFGFNKLSVNVLNENKPALSLYINTFCFSKYSDVDPNYEDVLGVSHLVKSL
jgi:GNAT superfamily N-acetyltransferase